jgi:hypothetical protein
VDSTNPEAGTHQPVKRISAGPARGARTVAASGARGARAERNSSP